MMKLVIFVSDLKQLAGYCQGNSGLISSSRPMAALVGIYNILHEGKTGLAFHFLP